MRTPVESLFTRRRWTADDARAVLAALDRSGKSVCAFAAEHGFDPQRLYAWRRRVADGDPITFREVTVRPPPRAETAEAPLAGFEIALASGVVIRVPPTFEAAALARLLEVLAQARSC